MHVVVPVYGKRFKFEHTQTSKKRKNRNAHTDTPIMRASTVVVVPEYGNGSKAMSTSL